MQRLQWQTRKLPVPQRGLKSPEHRIARADPALPNEHVDDRVMIGMQGGTCLDVGPARGMASPVSAPFAASAICLRAAARTLP